LAIGMLLKKSTKDFLNLPEWVRGCNWNTFQSTLRSIKPVSVADVAVAFMLSQHWAIKQGARREYIFCGELARRPKIDPLLEPATRTTRGRFLFVEQILEVLHQVLGSLDRAYRFRRGIWSGDESQRAVSIAIFLQRARRCGIPRKRAELILKTMTDTKGKLSSRCHSLEYASLIYRAAYMRAHFPTEVRA
jgi:DNA polymerase III alpha subunit